jgi:HPt (histidine-containing phosphotransfer) domain-containing protein
MPDAEQRCVELERELRRVRRSRQVLMNLLWQLDREWRLRLEALEAENRRLWSSRRLIVRR